MASCGDEDCNEFDSTKAKWFKIDQQGQVSDGSNTWVQKETRMLLLVLSSPRFQF